MGKTLLWGAGVAAVLLMVIFHGWGESMAVVSRIDPLALAGLCLLQLLTLAVTALQWRYLIGLSQKRLSFFRAFAVHLAGNFVESVTPSVKIGGEAAKVYLFRRATGLSYVQLSGILVVQKLLSFVPFAALVILLLLYTMNRWTAPTAVPITVFVLVLLLTAVVLSGLKLRTKQPRGRFGRAAAFVGEALSYGKGLVGTKQAAVLGTLSLLVWVLYPVKVWLVIQLLDMQLELPLVAAAVFSAYAIGLIPVLPGSLGSFEAAMSLFLSQLGLPAAGALAVTLVARFITFWFPLLCSAGAAFALRRTADIWQERCDHDLDSDFLQKTTRA